MPGHSDPTEAQTIPVPKRSRRQAVVELVTEALTLNLVLLVMASGGMALYTLYRLGFRLRRRLRRRKKEGTVATPAATADAADAPPRRKKVGKAD